MNDYKRHIEQLKKDHEIRCNITTKDESYSGRLIATPSTPEEIKKREEEREVEHQKRIKREKELLRIKYEDKEIRDYE